MTITSSANKGDLGFVNQYSSSDCRSSENSHYAMYQNLLIEEKEKGEENFPFSEE